MAKKGPDRIGTKEYTGKVIGREEKVVSSEDVIKLAALGCNNTEIAHFFGIKPNAVEANFHDELIIGRAEQKVRLRRAMMENACTKMNPAIQIFLAKNMLGMRDTPLETEDQKPLPWID